MNTMYVSAVVMHIYTVFISLEVSCDSQDELSLIICLLLHIGTELCS